MAIAFFCAGYVFGGIGIIGLATMTGNEILIVLALVAYVLNLALLHHVVKKPR